MIALDDYEREEPVHKISVEIGESSISSWRKMTEEITTETKPTTGSSWKIPRKIPLVLVKRRR